MTTLLPLRVVVYISGVRFWPRSISYTAPYGGHASFSVDVPAVPEWDLLPPRSHGAIFFLDPVQNAWRLLCEGEYHGCSFSKVASGVRSRVLTFRDIHGSWNSTNFVGLSSYVGSSPDATAVKSMCNGTNLIGSGGEQTGGNNRVLSLNVIVDTVTQANTRISSFFKDLIQMVSAQTPVESFYSTSRRVADKMFAFADPEIGSIVDSLRMQDLIKNGFNSAHLEESTTLEDIIVGYENLAMYHHTPVPAPPIYGKDVATTIPEMFFLPQLYTVVPPACNVIFESQITGDSGARQLLQEPTRAVVQLAGILDTNPKNVFFMANSTLDAVNVVAQAELTVNNPVLALTHDKFSAAELQSGVVIYPVSVGLEKVTATRNPTGVTAPAEMDNYLSNAARHHYEVGRGALRNESLQCSFLPYLLPGFPSLVEDASGPRYGIIKSVSHTLDCSGSASTQVELGFVRELYVLEGVNRSSPVPNWLNHLFWPSNISAFYKQAFGSNAYDFGTGYYSAMVSSASITQEAKAWGPSSPMDASSQCSIDALAALVVPTPAYDLNYNRTDIDPALTVSYQLAATADPVGARLLYQFRPGTTLEQYMAFHLLEGANSLSATSDSISLQDPPTDLSPQTVKPDGHELYGHAYGLKYVGPGNGSPYGYYALVEASNGAKISPRPQAIARIIQAAIDVGITRV